MENFEFSRQKLFLESRYFWRENSNSKHQVVKIVKITEKLIFRILIFRVKNYFKEYMDFWGENSNLFELSSLNFQFGSILSNL